jgi:membrane protein implicated in regulation of membrane protease activity
MESVFLGCFLFGALFTLVSALLGVAGSHLDMPGHVHTDGTGPLHLHPEGVLPLFLSSSAILAFVTWFGAAGYLALHYGTWSLVAALIAALLLGLAGAGVMVAVLAKIRAGEQVLDPQDYRLEGITARVSVSIPENGVGEIVFNLAGSLRNAAARSLDGTAVPQGSQVVILHDERGITQVQPLQMFLEREGLDAQQASRRAIEE